MKRAWVFLVFASCAGAELRGRTSTLHDEIKTARDDGAYNCAPHELAMAESHTAFAETELDEGDYYRARQELEVAEPNAREAITKSPKDKCNPDVKVEKPKQVVIQRLDTDGDGIYDDVDKCPNDPEDKDGFQDDDGCPDPDNDADGILDKDDKCPNDPEDKDGFEDADGCPDLDNDKDGIADKIDQCPNDPEDKDGFQDDDGCPDPDNDKDGFADNVDRCPNDPGVAPDGCPKKLVVVTSTKIEIKQTIYFDFDKATIKPVSYEILNAVAQALKDHPSIKVEIQGHTDSQGDDDWNLKLSQNRAESVRTYLINGGVAADRMTAKGYGETVPIADNRTDQGRAQNRRVEFIITSQ